MQTADFNHNDFTNTAEADKTLMVKFFYKNVQNKMETVKQGRAIFKEKTYIEIRVAGQRDALVCRPATYNDKQRFALHFDAFEKRVAPPTEGTPLMEWNSVSRSQAEELAFIHIKTVEQLSTVKDSNIRNFMGGYTLKEKAKKWLENNDSEANDREKEEMREELKLMLAQIAELLAAKSDEKPAPEPIEGAAVVVPAAPAAKKATARPRRKR